MSNAFSTRQFYVAIGFDPRDLSCGIYVGNDNPGILFSPPYGRVHIITHKFEFTSANKIPFARIITALRGNVTPMGGYNHPSNPDNKHLIGIPSDRVHDLITGLRTIIAGLSEYDDLWIPHFIETVIPVDKIEKVIIEQSLKALNPFIPSAVIITSQQTHVHIFDVVL